MIIGIPTVHAQNTPGDSIKVEGDVVILTADTTEVKFGNRVLVIVKDSSGKSIRLIKESDDESKKDEEAKSRIGLAGLDFGWSNYFTGGQFGTPTGLEGLELNNGGSLHVGLHLFPITAPLNKKGSVNIKTALSFDFNKFRLANNVEILPNQDTLTLIPRTEDFRANKLRVTYVQIPLLLHFETRPKDKKHSVGISLGAYGGVRIGAKTKLKANGEVFKEKDDFNLNRLKYGVSFRIDFRWFDFYVNYNLSSLFRNNQAPNLQTFSAGINLVDF